MILEIDEKTRRISLGGRQLGVDPWLLREAVYSPGKRIIGKVATLVPFGAFVTVEPEIDGLVHIHDITWNPEPMDALKELVEGDELEVVVLNYDTIERRLGLGLKQVTESITDFDGYLTAPEAVPADVAVVETTTATAASAAAPAAAPTAELGTGRPSDPT